MASEPGQTLVRDAAPPRIVFACRRAPDWSALSRDFRAGRPIARARYLPPEPVPGFPRAIGSYISRWNRTFRIDFFTFRAEIAALSRASVARVANSASVASDDPALVDLAKANPGALIYFHDDDDFFAPNIAEATASADPACDVVVTPLFRVGIPTFTFVPPDVQPTVLWGDARACDMHFQSNNYGIRAGGAAGGSKLAAFADHVAASEHADRTALRITYLADPVSATVKTPGSASMLRRVFGPRAMLLDMLGRSGRRDGVFEAFGPAVDANALPEEYRWASDPANRIAALVASVR